MQWYVYILKCRDGALYTGLTDEITRRFQEHISGKGGVYTERNRPERLLYYETFNKRVDAEKREKQIKRWSKAKKEALINGNLTRLRSLSVSRD